MTSNSVPDILVQSLRLHARLSDDMVAVLSRIPTEQARFRDGEIIINGQERLTRSCLLRRGFAVRSHHVGGASRFRVITSLHVPGDLMDLHGFVLKRILHDIVAVGPVMVNFIDHESLRQITRSHPRLTHLLMGLTTRDAAINRQWLVAGATLHSTAHLAHLLSELNYRLSRLGLAPNGTFDLPLLQRDLGDVLGYSAVHINRSVRELRDRGLVKWQNHRITICDVNGLARLSHFDPTYLQLSANI